MGHYVFQTPLCGARETVTRILLIANSRSPLVCFFFIPVEHPPLERQVSPKLSMIGAERNIDSRERILTRSCLLQRACPFAVSVYS